MPETQQGDGKPPEKKLLQQTQSEDEKKPKTTSKAVQKPFGLDDGLMAVYG